MPWSPPLSAGALSARWLPWLMALPRHWGATSASSSVQPLLQSELKRGCSSAALHHARGVIAGAVAAFAHAELTAKPPHSTQSEQSLRGAVVLQHLLLLLLLLGQISFHRGWSMPP